MDPRQPPLETRHGRRVLDLDRYIPYFLVALTNAISRGASRVYLDRFGIGIMDWRVMTTLAIRPGCAGRDISALIHLDKGAVSRSLSGLAGRGLVRAEGGGRDPRRRHWQLTEAGRELHDAVLEIALERESRLVEGIPEAELEVFLAVVRRMQANLSHLEEET